LAQNNVGHALQDLFARAGATVCLYQIQLLARDPAIRDEPTALAPLLGLTFVCHTVTGRNAEAGRAIDDLVGLVERQPQDFRLPWSWKPLKDFLPQVYDRDVKRHPEILLQLVEALSRNSRDAIAAGLKEVRAGFARACSSGTWDGASPTPRAGAT
jgi:hypothetical protein